MSKRHILIIVFALLASFLLSISASADQDGNDTWCNTDQYGCWVTAEDGSKCYIMFWSEASRAYIMGGHSKPGELVTDRPAQASLGRMGMKSPYGDYTWKEYLEDMLWSHAEYLKNTLKGSTIEEYIIERTRYYESQVNKGDETEDGMMDVLYKWDKQLTEKENK